MDTADQHAAALAIVHEEAGRTLSKHDFELCMRIAKRAMETPSEHEKAMADAVIYGTGIMKDGQHVPLDQVRAQSDAPQLLPCRVCGSTTTPTRTISGHGEHWFTCVSCREQTPRLKSKLQCVLAWNARATPQPMTPESTADAIDAVFRRNLDLRIQNLTVSDKGEITWIAISCRGVVQSLYPMGQS